MQTPGGRVLQAEEEQVGRPEDKNRSGLRKDSQDFSVTGAELTEKSEKVTWGEKAGVGPGEGGAGRVHPGRLSHEISFLLCKRLVVVV